MLQRRDAIKYDPIFTSSFPKLEQVARQAFWANNFSALLDEYVTIFDVLLRNILNIKKRVVLIAKVTGLLADRNLFGQPSPEGIRSRDNYAIIDT